MVRTVIGLQEEDKVWLDRQAEEEQVSMAELVRRAVRRYREVVEREERPLEQLLTDTSGIWTEGDGLAFQNEIRGEWDDR
ncbi:MAG: ribbon-helix-helix protein, CopG family [bacterium]|nr:ribbon-helix-helix protein, CopG family [bacterium]